MMSQSGRLGWYKSHSKGRMHTKAKQSRGKQESIYCHFNNSAGLDAVRSHLYQTMKLCLKEIYFPNLHKFHFCAVFIWLIAKKYLSYC